MVMENKSMKSRILFKKKELYQNDNGVEYVLEEFKEHRYHHHCKRLAFVTLTKKGSQGQNRTADTRIFSNLPILKP